jgi:hypothetical protein
MSGIMQAQQLLEVLGEHGPEYLETWQLPQLTWNELQELKAHYEAEPAAIEAPDPGGCTTFPAVT